MTPAQRVLLAVYGAGCLLLSVACALVLVRWVAVRLAVEGLR
jgi:hypothetical protein